MSDKIGNSFWMGANLISNLANRLQKDRASKEKKIKELQAKSSLLFLGKENDKKTNIYILKKICSSNKKSYALLGDMLEDMYRFNFSDFSSVEQNNLETEEQKNDYSLLAKIDLFEHSLGVFNNMHKLIEKTYGEYFHHLLMAALVHDFGKCSSLCEEYKITKELTHCQKSAIYFKMKVQEIGKYLNGGWTEDEMRLLQIVVNAVDAQHNKNSRIQILSKEDKNKQENGIEKLFIDFLMEADKNQRESEVFFLKNKSIVTF